MSFLGARPGDFSFVSIIAARRRLFVSPKAFPKPSRRAWQYAGEFLRPAGLSPIDCRARRVSDTPGGEWRVLLLQKDKTMAETKKLAATVRSGTGKGAARSARREGRTPAVLYGGGEAPTPLSLDTRTVTKLIFAGHFLTTIFELEVDGKTERAIPRDYQLDVVKDLPDPRRLPAPEARLAPARSKCRCTSSITKPRPASSAAARSTSSITRSSCGCPPTIFRRRSPPI